MIAVFTTVLFASLYGSIVGVILLVVTRMLDGRVCPKWQLAFWALLIIKLIVPFGPQSNLSLFNTVNTVYSDAATKMSGDLFVATGLNNYYLYSEISGNSAGGTLNSAGPDTSSIKQQQKQADTAFTVEAGSTSKPETLKILAYGWAIGSAAAFSWFVAVNIRLGRELKKKNQCVPRRVSAVVTHCAAAMGIKRIPEIVLKEDIASPALFGLIKPKILVNNQLLSFGDDEVRYVIVHELAHYKRKDILINYLLVLFQAIHWFNPVIWLCFTRIRQYVEQDCDQSAIRFLQQNEDIPYAKTMLEVAIRTPYTRLGAQLFAASGGKKNIARRIHMIKQSPIIRRHRILTFTLCLLMTMAMGAGLLTSAALSNSHSALYKKLDAFFVKDPSFSGSVVISQGGNVVFSNSYGMADNANNIRMAADTKIPIGLMTSQFTLAGIMQLYERGALDLNDKLSKYVPHFPRGDEITVHELLVHTSGIEDYESVFILQHLDEATEDALIDLICGFNLRFVPGTKQEYSGSNYILLGYILEQVSGMPYEAYLRENIFTPLGMKNTGIIYANGQNNIAAIAYTSAPQYSIYEPDSYIRKTVMEGYTDMLARCALGSHGMYSTAYDLSLWTQAILSDGFLSRESRSLLFKFAANPPGTYYSDEYGWGTSDMKEWGTKFWTLARDFGYFSYCFAYPERDIYVSIVSNAGGGGHAEWYGADIMSILNHV